MTCIAWDGRNLAGDRMRTIYNTPTAARKVWRTRSKDGRRFLVGCAGEIEDCVQFVRWMKSQDPAQKPAPTNFIALVIDERRRIWLVEQKLVYFQVREKAWAVGCGSDYALAAMACGKSAAQAVRIASRFDHRVGMGVDTIGFG